VDGRWCVRTYVRALHEGVSLEPAALGETWDWHFQLMAPRRVERMRHGSAYGGSVASHGRGVEVLGIGIVEAGVLVEALKLWNNVWA
jgi:hypothetical protein